MNFQKYTYYTKSALNLLLGFKNPLLIIKIFLGGSPDQTYQVELRKYPLRFHVRGAMDVWSLKETFLDRFYERFGTPLHDKWTVIDIGAGLGDYTIFAVFDHSNNRIFAFEPFPESFVLLNKNIAVNGTQEVHTFKQAVAGQSGQMILDFSGGEPLQITSGELHQHAQINGDKMVVESISLADTLIKNDISQCDLLKLDCEGAEFDIIFNTTEEILYRIKRIVMEYHDGVTKYSHKDMVAFLQTNGYRVKVNPNFVHEDIGYIYAELINL